LALWQILGRITKGHVLCDCVYSVTISEPFKHCVQLIGLFSA